MQNINGDGAIFPWLSLTRQTGPKWGVILSNILKTCVKKQELRNTVTQPDIGLIPSF